MDFPSKGSINKWFLSDVLISFLSFILRTCQAQMTPPFCTRMESRCPRATFLHPKPHFYLTLLSGWCIKGKQARYHSTSRTFYCHSQPCLLKIFTGRNGLEEASGSTALLWQNPFSLLIQQCRGSLTKKIMSRIHFPSFLPVKRL